MEAGEGRGGDSGIVGDQKIGPRWRVSPDDARRLAAFYGWTLVSDRVTPLGGAVNGVARIHTSVGDLVVRVHRPWTNPGRLSAVHAVQDRLRTLGIPIPPVLRTSSGETFVIIPGGPSGPPRQGAEHDRLVEVTEAVIADPVRVSRRHANLALSMLAPLHNALATIDTASVPQPTYAAHVDVLEAVTWLDATDAAFAMCTRHAGFTRANAVRTTARDLIDRIRRDRLALQPQLPRQLVHGDLGFDNVLVRDGRVVAVLDFDFMAERPRIFDLAYAQYHTLTRLRASSSAGALTPDELRWLANHVSAYTSAADRPLTGPELVALPLVMVMAGLFQAVEAGYVSDDPPRAIAQTLSIEQHLPMIAWLVEASHEITSACRVAIGSSRA